MLFLNLHMYLQTNTTDIGRGKGKNIVSLPISAFNMPPPADEPDDGLGEISHAQSSSPAAKVRAKETCIHLAMADLAKLQTTLGGVEFALSDVDVSTWESMAGK